MADSITFNVTLNKDEHKELIVESVKQVRSKSSLARKYIKEGLKKDSKKKEDN